MKIKKQKNVQIVFRLRQRFKEFCRNEEKYFHIKLVKKIGEFNLLQFSQELLKFHLSPPFTSFYKEKKEWVSFWDFFVTFGSRVPFRSKLSLANDQLCNLSNKVLSSNLQRFVLLFVLTFSVESLVNADLSPIMCLINLCDNCVIKKLHLLLIIAPNN